MARRVLSQGSRTSEGTGIRREPADFDRDQLDLLRLAKTGELPQMGEHGARWLCVFRQGAALCHQPARPCRSRRLHQAVSEFRRARARRSARTDAVAIRADQKIRCCRLRKIPRTLAGEGERNASAPRGGSAAPKLWHAGFRGLIARSSARRSCSPTMRPILRSPTCPAISSMRACKRDWTRYRLPIRRKISTHGLNVCEPGHQAKCRTTYRAVDPAYAAKKRRAARRLRLRDS